MTMRFRRQRDSWVMWLTGLFVLVAVAVFTFVIVRNRRPTSEPLAPNPIPDAVPPMHTGPGQFRLVRITDGDSLTLVGSDGLDLSIRLRGIDAPELGQPHGLEAKQALQALVGGASVRLDEPKKGKYGRYVANVFVGDVWINEAMVVNGHAWCDQVNSFDRRLYAAEKAAREKGGGLWASPSPVPPWIWRADRR